VTKVRLTRVLPFKLGEGVLLYAIWLFVREGVREPEMDVCWYQVAVRSPWGKW
jgi:hypothetical protein